MAQQKNTNRGAWRTILNEWELSEFEESFKSNGFTDVVDWLHIDKNDMTQMGFKKGHILRFTRKLKEYNESPHSLEGRADHHTEAPPEDDAKEQMQIMHKHELLGGDGWIELGDFRMGQVDDAHFSFSHRVNRKTIVIFRKDGTIHPGPRTDFGLFDRAYVKGLRNVTYGDGWIQLSDWRIGVCDNNRDHLSISHKSKHTCMIWRSDGTRHKGPRKDWNNYWDRINVGGAEQYGLYYVVDKEDDNTYIKWIQFGDNWRIGDVDTDHFSISANKAFFKYDNYTTAVIYRRDGTIHPGRRTDFGLWQNKRRYKTISLLS
eukprot:81541_1